MSAGVSERDELFQLLPRLLRVLPSADTHEALSALYPALISAAAHDPRLSALAALSPLLAHVVAAAVAHPSEPAREAAAVLLHALALRTGVSRAAGALVQDLARTLGRLPRAGHGADAAGAGARAPVVCGRLPFLVDFGNVAMHVKDLVPAAESPTKDTGLAGSGDWPHQAISVRCNSATRRAIVDLLIRFVYSPVWLRLGPVARNATVRLCLDSGESSLLLAFKNARKSAVPLSRPLAMAVDEALSGLINRETLGDASSEEYPRLQPENRFSTPRPKKRLRHREGEGEITSPSKIFSSHLCKDGLCEEPLLLIPSRDIDARLRELCTCEFSVELLGETVALCEHIHGLAQDSDGLRMLAQESGLSMVVAAALAMERESQPERNRRLFIPVLNLCAVLLELAAAEEVNRVTEAVPDSSISLTASRVLSSQTIGPGQLPAFESRKPSCMPQLSLAILAIFRALLMSLSNHVDENEDARSILLCASMVLWRLTDVSFASALLPDVGAHESNLIATESAAEPSACLAVQQQLFEVASKLIALALDPPVLRCIDTRSAALRASSRALASLCSAIAASEAESTATRVCTLIHDASWNDGTSGTISGALYALADLVCGSASCHHCVFGDSTSTAVQEWDFRPSRQIGFSMWVQCYETATPMVGRVGPEPFIGAAARVLGRLVLHAPPRAKKGAAAARLVQALWHPSSRGARSEAALALQRIFIDPGREPQGASAAGAVSDGPKDGVEHVAAVGKDGASSAQVVDHPGQLQNGSCIAIEDVASLLVAELRAQNERVSASTVGADVLAVLARLPKKESSCAITGVAALALSQTIAASVLEQQNIRNLALTSKKSGSHVIQPSSLDSWTALVNMGVMSVCDMSVNLPTSRTLRSGMHMVCGIAQCHHLLSISSRAKRVDFSYLGDHSVGVIVSDYLMSRCKEWVPIAIEQLLRDMNYTKRLTAILGEADERTFWEKVPRFALGPVLQDGNREILEALAVHLDQSSNALVERVCADVVARTALLAPNDLSDACGKTLQMMQDVMQQRIGLIVDKHEGKIIQKIVMEFGSKRDEDVRSALTAVNQVQLREGTKVSREIEDIVTEHFLLVMDAVNRGLFASWVSSSERQRCLLVLDGVLQLCKRTVNLFVPKVMATLKMALELQGISRRFREKVCKVWVTFVRCLGPTRIGPHIASTIAILAPYLAQHHRVIAPALCKAFIDGQEHVKPYFSDVALLITTIGHTSLIPIAEIVSGDPAPDSARGTLDGKQERGSSSDFVGNSLEILEIAMKHDSPAIRALALDRLFQMLRRSRCVMLTSGKRSKGNTGDNEPYWDEGFLARLVRDLTSLLSYTDVECRHKVLKCLGELGAVDPMRLGSSAAVQSVSHEVRVYPRSMRILAKEVLSDFLVPALWRGDKQGAGNRLNRLGLAVQELLRVCGCNADTPNEANAIAQEIERSAQEWGNTWEANLENASPSTLGAHFWGRLSGQVQQASQPYLALPFATSTYNAGVAVSSVGGFNDGLADQTLDARGPIWIRLAAAADGGKVDPSEWKMQLTAYLTDFIGDRGEMGGLLKAIRPVLRHEDGISTYILPLVMMACIDCVASQRNTAAEKDSVSLPECSDNACATSLASSALFKFIISELNYALEAGGESAQSVFLTLDILRHWRINRAESISKPQIASARRHGQLPDRDAIVKAIATDPLTLLVDLEGRSMISLLVLARAAQRSRAYSRAILYCEQHIRNVRRCTGLVSWPAHMKRVLGSAGQTEHGDESRSGESNARDQQVTAANDESGRKATVSAKSRSSQVCDGERDALRIMQRCFAEVEDSDSMAGVGALRRDTSLTEAIIDAEASGSFDDALLGYERALAASPRNPVLHTGFLQCLRTLGHWETMLAHADGLVHSLAVTEDPLRRSACALGIEAAWRLGRWDRVAQICQESQSYSTTGRPPGLTMGSPNSCTITDSSSASDDLSLLGYRTEWEASYGSAVGRMLDCIRRKDIAAMEGMALEARCALLAPSVNAALEGYARAYPLIVRLHVLADIEDTMRVVCGRSTVSRLHMSRVEVADREQQDISISDCERSYDHEGYMALVSADLRSNSTSTLLKVREPILSCRRVCLELLGKLGEAASVSLQLAKQARSSGNLRAASAAVYRAMGDVDSESDEWFAASMEMARIQAARGDRTGALLSLEKDIDRMSLALRGAQEKMANEGTDRIRIKEAQVESCRLRLARAHMLAGRWIEDARSAPPEVIVEHYKRATALSPSEGEPFYMLGRFYDSLVQAGRGTTSRDLISSSSPHPKLDFVPLVVGNFADALLHDHGLVYEVLPRMLTVWFDFFSLVQNVQANDGPSVSVEVEKAVRRLSQRALHTLPKYMWMTVLPQLMSRLLHPSSFVREELQALLASVVEEFPDQAVWMIAPSSQLSMSIRRDAAGEILNKAVQCARKRSNSITPTDGKQRAAALKRRIRDGLVFVKHLIDVCTVQAPKEKRGRSDNCSKEFSRMRTEIQTASIIVPTLAALTVALPYQSGVDQSAASSTFRYDAERHHPFSPEPVTISDVETTVLVMSSLMRPRRIGFVGSDGRRYRFLAKRETAGDMRKDSRLMDYLTVVNRLLAKEPKAQSRSIRLKTYAVLPLTEETGLIEWVNDINPLRAVVRDEHSSLGAVPDTNTIQSKYQSMDKLKFLVDWAIPSFPAVLDRFFLRQFGSHGDPQAWLSARTNWTRSVAAWSMTGYIVGLGDRHGENILIETKTGMCVHVDFAMLFDKGLTLKVPEIVPFRLTQNMVTAMGVAGYEGGFRVASEIVLGVLRGNADALTGVLESFLHDPLADWAKGAVSAGRKSGAAAAGHYGLGDEGNNSYAADMRRAVERKLKGMMGSTGIPLSIEGQVQRLIHEATSLENLSKMYIWWTAWC